MLESWRNEAGESASPNTLLRAAKYLRLTDLAGGLNKLRHYLAEKSFLKNTLRKWKVWNSAESRIAFCELM